MLSRKRKLTGQVLTDTVCPHKYIVHTCICKQFFYHKSLKIWCLLTLRQWNTKKWILPMQSFLCQGRKVSFAQYTSAFTPVRHLDEFLSSAVCVNFDPRCPPFLPAYPWDRRVISTDQRNTLYPPWQVWKANHPKA